MTAPTKPRAKRNSTALRAAIAVDRIRAIYADQEQRIADAASDIRTADSEKAGALLARVPAGLEREDAVTMLDALKLTVLMPTEEPPPPSEEPPADDLPAGARPLDPERQKRIAGMTGSRR